MQVSIFGDKLFGNEKSKFLTTPEADLIAYCNYDLLLSVDLLWWIHLFKDFKMFYSISYISSICCIFLSVFLK